MVLVRLDFPVKELGLAMEALKCDFAAMDTRRGQGPATLAQWTHCVSRDRGRVNAVNAGAPAESSGAAAESEFLRKGKCKMTDSDGKRKEAKRPNTPKRPQTHKSR